MTMLTLATQTFANGIWTITPEEPPTLQLALVGMGTLAAYAAVTGWRLRRSIVANDASMAVELGDADVVATRRAA